MALASARLSTYLVLVAAGLLAALFLGRPEPALLALPFALALAGGLAVARPPSLSASVELESGRVLEGEPVELRATIRAASAVPRLDVLLRLPAGLESDGPAAVAARLAAGGERVFTWRLRGRRWGVFQAGLLEVGGRDSLGLLRWTETLDLSRPLRVFPAYEHLRRALAPLRTQAFAGNTVSRLRGEGIEFADLRPHAAGDPERRINWRASARRGSLQVNDLHPERNTDVVLFVDTFSEVRGPGRSSLDLAVRGAAALAEHHLSRRDRVGLVGFGGTLRWLRPAMGGRQLYRLVDALLETEVVLSYAWKGVEVLPARTLPPNALVVAFTPLLDERTRKALVDLRGRGHDLTIVELPPEAYVRPGQGRAAQLAFRIWQLEREALRARYRALGAPIVLWDAEAPFQAALEEVAGLRRHARLARA